MTSGLDGSTDPGFQQEAVQYILLWLILEEGSIVSRTAWIFRPMSLAAQAVPLDPQQALPHRAFSEQKFCLLPSFCAWQPSFYLLDVVWFSSLHLPRMHSFSDSLFFESEPVVTYQKISVPDRKKIEAEYHQGYLIFRDCCIVSLQSQSAAVSTFCRVTLENMRLFL